MRIFAAIIAFFTSLFQPTKPNIVLDALPTPTEIISISKINLSSPSPTLPKAKQAIQPTTRPTNSISATSSPATSTRVTPTAIPTAVQTQSFTPTTTPIPQPTYTTATSCSSVTISGASYGGNQYGKEIYYTNSSSTITITANTTPPNGKVAWKVASFSNQLPNGGSFSATNQPTTTYTAPPNNSGSDQGVEIRGDISEYPGPWLYCPPFTLAIHTN